MSLSTICFKLVVGRGETLLPRLLCRWVGDDERLNWDESTSNLGIATFRGFDEVVISGGLGKWTILAVDAKDSAPVPPPMFDLRCHDGFPVCSSCWTEPAEASIICGGECIPSQEVSANYRLYL